MSKQIDTSGEASRVNTTHSLAVYKKKLQQWKYRKNHKRKEVVGASQPGEPSRSGNEISTTSLGAAESRRKRNGLGGSRRTVKTSPLRMSPNRVSYSEYTPRPRVLQSPDALHIFETLLDSAINYIEGSFGNKTWKMNGMERIITSSSRQESDLEDLHAFLTAVDSRCSYFAACNAYVGGMCWRQAFMKIETLVRSSYHDVIPNIIQKINDLQDQNHVQFAEVLKRHVSQLGTINRPVGDVQASIYKVLASIRLDQMRDLEEMLMNCYSKLFDAYLGDRCYGSFVMTMDSVNRKVLHNKAVDLNDVLPSLSILDTKFGPTDRRALDVLRFRIETLFDRKQYRETHTYCSILIDRAEIITNDEWQRHYFLIKGLYYAGSTALHITGCQPIAEQNLSRCYDLIEHFHKMNFNSRMFSYEQAQVLEHLVQLTCSSENSLAHSKWKTLHDHDQHALSAEDNSMLLWEELSGHIGIEA